MAEQPPLYIIYTWYISVLQVRVGDDDHIHLRIFQSLPHAGGTKELAAVQKNKTLEDELEYFQ